MASTACAARISGGWPITEIHSGVTRGPWVNGDQFVTENTYDITFKPTSKRNTMNETAVYTVRDGKIVHEAFFLPL